MNLIFRFVYHAGRALVHSRALQDELGVLSQILAQLWEFDALGNADDLDL